MEIDWPSYMEQVDIYWKGERDFTKLVGPLGPANYPAGFIYLYQFFYFMVGTEPLPRWNNWMNWLFSLIYCFGCFYTHKLY